MGTEVSDSHLDVVRPEETEGALDAVDVSALSNRVPIPLASQDLGAVRLLVPIGPVWCDVEICDTRLASAALEAIAVFGVMPGHFAALALGGWPCSARWASWASSAVDVQRNQSDDQPHSQTAWTWREMNE